VGGLVQPLFLLLDTRRIVDNRYRTLAFFQMDHLQSCNQLISKLKKDRAEYDRELHICKKAQTHT